MFALEAVKRSEPLISESIEGVTSESQLIFSEESKEKIKHLSFKQLVECIWRYYNGRASVASLSFEYNIKITSKGFVGILPAVLVSFPEEHQCHKCGGTVFRRQLQPKARLNYSRSEDPDSYYHCNNDDCDYQIHGESKTPFMCDCENCNKLRIQNILLGRFDCDWEELEKAGVTDNDVLYFLSKKATPQEADFSRLLERNLKLSRYANKLSSIIDFLEGVCFEQNSAKSMLVINRVINCDMDVREAEKILNIKSF